MADPKIIHKKSSVAAKVPLSTDLEQGELAINLTDQKIYSKDGSGNVVIVGEVNAGGGGTATVTRGEFTATEGQTTFTHTYEATTLTVYLNGVLLDDVADYTATNGTSITLVVGASAGDLLTAIHYSTFTVADETFTGQIKFDDGSAAAPSITNTGDTNTGLFFPAADAVGVSVAGTEAVRVDSSGKVGIGTTTPSAVVQTSADNANQLTLHRDNNANGAGNILTFAADTSTGAVQNYAQIGAVISDNTNGAEGGYLSFTTVGGGALSERMRIDSSGNVGIGTSSPTSPKITVNEDGGGQILLGRQGAHQSAYMAWPLITARGDGDLGSNQFGVGAVYGFWYQGAGMTNPAAETIGFRTGSSERMRIDSSGNVIVGGNVEANAFESTYNGGFAIGSVGGVPRLQNDGSNNIRYIDHNDTERMRISSAGGFYVGKTTDSIGTVGFEHRNNGVTGITTSSDTPLVLNRQSTDGELLNFRHNNIAEGSISISGTTVSYNGGHLARWSRLPDGTDDSNILKGTVMTNLDQMIEWTDEDGNPEDNEQLNFTNTSSVEGDPNVAGVFVAWDDSDEWGDYYLAMTGDMVIRIAQGVTVQRGDLLMSAGDGTAKPQEDDLVRSKTIAKVISTHKSHEYADGSYCVPCVLMAC